MKTLFFGQRWEACDPLFLWHNEVENSYFQNKTSITDSGIVFGKATVATVAADGTVTCLAVGKTEITAKSGGGSCPCPCNISGAGYQLSVEPAGDDAQIAWSAPSLADGILLVDDSGYITTLPRWHDLRQKHENTALQNHH